MKRRHLINPLEAIGAIRPLPADEQLTEQILAQVCLNELLTGRNNGEQSLLITRALVMGMVIASDSQNRPMHTLLGKALQLWLKCQERSVGRNEIPNPSTTERDAVVGALRSWITALDKVFVGQFRGAEIAWNNLKAHYDWREVHGNA